MIESWVNDGRLAGAVVERGTARGPAATLSLGWHDVADRRPMRPDGIFRLASATKLLTTVVAMRLIDQGLICGLDDAVARYLPGFPSSVVTHPDQPREACQLEPVQRDVSIRDLMRHTAGIQYAFGLNALDAEYMTLGFPNWNSGLAEFASAMASLPLAFQPGTQVCYGYGYDILGRVMEVVCDAPLDVLMREWLTHPLGLTDTGFSVPASEQERLVPHYEHVDGRLFLQHGRIDRRFLVLPAGLSAGGGWQTGYGGMLSTAQDFGRVLRMLLNHGADGGTRILRSESVEEIFRDQTRLVPHGTGRRFPPALELPGRGFGLGGAVDAVASGHTLHWGGAPYNTSFLVDRTLGRYGILLAQTGPFEAEFVEGGLKHKFRQWVRQSAPQVPSGT